MPLSTYFLPSIVKFHSTVAEKKSTVSQPVGEQDGHTSIRFPIDSKKHQRDGGR